MRVHSYITTLLASCCLGGLGMMWTISDLGQAVDWTGDRSTEAKVTQRELSQLGASFSHWLLVSDLILGSDMSYLSGGAEKMSQKLTRQVAVLMSSTDGRSMQSSVRQLESFITHQDKRLLRAGVLDDEDRTQRLAELLDAMDEDSGPAIEAIEVLVSGIASAVLRTEQNHRTAIKRRAAATWGLGALFAGLIFCAWLWTSRRLSSPITRLTKEARTATQTLTDAALTSSGPKEVVELAASFGELAASLEARVKERTEHLRETNRDLECARQQAESASHAKGQFLATMSHEIRTPMNGVIGMLELLSETELSANQCEFADTAKSSAGALMSILNDILDYSKMEAGELDVEHRPFDLVEITDEVLGLCAFEASEKGLYLSCVVEPGLERMSLGDPNKIRQVLLNLTNNAIKFTRCGTVEILCQQLTSSAESQRVRFSVVDSGVGIDPDSMAVLFEPFTQADGSYTRRFGGTGIGLSISKQLTELMKGTLGVESEVERGSTFWFEIELEVQDATGVARGKSTAIEKARPIAHKRIQLASALVDVRSMLKSELLRIGVSDLQETDHPTAFLQALKADIAERRPPDLLILTAEQLTAEVSQFLEDIQDQAPMQMIEIGAWGHTAPAWVTKSLSLPLRHCEVASSLEEVLAPVKTPGRFSAQVLAESKPLSEAQILVVEDNPVNQKVVCRLLEMFGCTVECVEDGKAGYEAVAAGAFDIVVMDCQMPIMDGRESTRMIRKLEDPAKRDVSIIALTANTMAGDREACMLAGMNDFLAKPVKKQVLRDALLKWMPAKQIRD